MKRELLFVIPLLFAAITSQAQSYNNLNNLINRDSLEKNLDNAIGSTILSEKKQIETSSKDVQMMLDAQAPFGIFKDCYFATGVPLNKQIRNRQMLSFSSAYVIASRKATCRSTHLPISPSHRKLFGIYTKNQALSETSTTIRASDSVNILSETTNWLVLFLHR